MNSSSKIAQADNPARNILTLATGNAAAMVIPLVVSPIITRLYTPGELGGLGLLTALAGTLSVVACGRYELGILLPAGARKAISLVWLSIVLCLCVSLLVLILIAPLGSSLSELLGAAELAPFLLLVPLLVFLTGVFNTLTQWLIRVARYRQLAVNRVTQNAGGALTTLALGFAGGGLIGLVGGALVAQLMGTAGLLRTALRTDLASRKPRIAEMRLLARRYSRLPRYSVLASFINAVGLHAPIVLFSAFFGPAIAGLFALANRVLTRPITVFSNSVSAVFKQRASEAYRAEGNCKRIFVKTALVLLAMSAPPFLVLLLAAPPIFAWVFGSDWRVAGEFAQILSVLLWIKFVGNPLCFLFYLAEALRSDLVYQFGFAAVTLISIVTGYAVFNDAKQALLFYVVAYSALYCIRIAHSYVLASGGPHVERISPPGKSE